MSEIEPNVSPPVASERRSSRVVVGIGASAGGLAALEGLFAHVPPDARMAFVIVQHLQADHPSSLAEILSKQTTMPVRQAVDGDTVEAGHVYTIPPNASMTIHRGVLSVKSPAEPRYGLIDHFLISLAKDEGNRAVCVILSGAGTDGTFGLRSIQENGGFSIVQSPDSAAYDSMPRSAIEMGLVDCVLPVEAIGTKLVEYAANVSAVEARGEGPEEANAEHMRAICSILLRQTNNDFSQYKRATLGRRVQRRMLVTEAGSLGAYVEHLRSHPEEVRLLFNELLIGVTQFFRDEEVFAALAALVLPKITAGRNSVRELRVWAAGCASGEEVYSIAILVREAMARLDHDLHVKIFGTDLDEAALDVARRGRYPESIAAHVTAERLERFFTKADGFYQIDKSIREMCIFSEHNLIRDPPFSTLHLISCRNLLIYLESDVQRRLVPLFHYALRPGGFLLLGPSESIAASPELFTLVDKKARIFQRNDAVLPTLLSFPIAERGGSVLRGGEAAARPALARSEAVGKMFERVLLEGYGPAAVVINERAEIVFISGKTGKYLELPPGATNVNVIDMARRGLRPNLHSAIHKAIRLHEETFDEGVAVEVNGHVQRINLSVRPLSEIEAGSGLFLVVFQDVGRPVPKESAGATVLVGENQELAKHLENELRTTKEHLRSTVEGFEAANEELKSANEELLSTNEELQSANEELQTSKEELQSMVEELHTVNSELSRKIEELDRASSDMQNLFASTNIATVFLDGELRIKKFSPEATKVFRLIASDIGRPITDIASTFREGDLVANVREVLRTLIPKEQQVRRAGSEQWYIQRVQPYRTVENAIAGVVITYVEITELRRAARKVAHFASLVDSAQDAIVGTDLRGIIVSWNTGAERMFGYTKAEAIGQPSSILAPPEERASLAAFREAVARDGSSAVEPFETVRRRRDGSLLDVYVRLSSVLEDDGSISGISMIAHDISERKESERRRGEFLAMLGHELRNPLAPIVNALFLLRQQAALEPRVVQSLDLLDRQVIHLTRLIDGLLDISRITNGKMNLHRERVDLAKLCATVLDDERGAIVASGVELATPASSSPVWVDGDVVRLSQVVTNLVHNALKFTDRGGRLSIEVRTEPENRAAVLCVRDSGVGMTPATLASVFAPFAQSSESLARSQEGLGLGLAVVKGLVELHGGRVEAKSEGLGRGSEFTVRLPLADPPTAEAERALGGAIKGGRPRRILVIDDNVDIVDSIKLVLELWKHEVAVAATGIEGIALAKAFRPEIVLCDIGLPGEMDGYAVAAALRDDPETAKAHRIALSGYGQADDQRRAREAGFEEHMTKPVEPGKLQRYLAGLD